MKNKIINLIETDIKNTEIALESGGYVNVFTKTEEFVSEDKKKFAQYTIAYLRDYLIPEIKKTR